MSAEVAARRSSVFWVALFLIGMFGTGIGARVAGLSGVWTMIVMLPPMLLLIPMIRSVERSSAAQGCASPALQRYNRRALTWSFAYVAMLFLAITVNDRLHPQGPLLWAIAILPALPILYMVWSFHRYLVEETDEYLKMRNIGNALVGMGVVLAVATVWGFLESFGVVPHAPGWLVVPLWGFGLGAAQIWRMVRGA
ncbi:hypothetical protein [Sphingopyxis sp. KK2]|uniref:hypothetical protein n=1 Tax=Sphingopyxis sp. KK2 TaxID=1855727 RepID=UPI00097E6D27|nr:hypothetical protein [Sphingopyxis sp. KK2]